MYTIGPINCGPPQLVVSFHEERTKNKKQKTWIFIALPGISIVSFDLPDVVGTGLMTLSGGPQSRF